MKTVILLMALAPFQVLPGQDPLPEVTLNPGNPQGGDSQPRLQAVLEAFKKGGVLHLVRGSYFILTDKPIALAADTTIRCDDGVEVWKPAGHAPVFTTGAVGNVHLIGGRWVGPGNQSAFLWKADGTWNASMESARVERFASAMNIGSLAECRHITFAGNTCSHNTLTGLSASAVTDINIRANTFEANGEVVGVTHGVYLISPLQALISGNRFIGNAGLGLQVSVTHKDKRPPAGLTITGNLFRGNGSANVSGGAILVSSAVDGVRDIQITRNRSENDFRGISVLSGVNYTVADNEIIDSGSVGLYLGEELDPHRAIHGLVTRNLVVGARGDAIQFGLPPDASELEVSDNEFLDNARGATVRPGYQAPVRIRLLRNHFEGTTRGPDVIPALAGRQ